MQRSFQPVKAQCQMRNLVFLISEAQHNFRNELFDSVDAKRNSAMFENTKIQRNATYAIAKVAKVALCPILLHGD